MKSKDIALIAVIVFLSALISFFISNAIFASPKNRQQQVEVVESITTDFPKPDSRYFNTNAFDPTKPISVGQNTNQNPFNSSSQ